MAGLSTPLTTFHTRVRVGVSLISAFLSIRERLASLTSAVLVDDDDEVEHAALLVETGVSELEAIEEALALH